MQSKQLTVAILALAFTFTASHTIAGEEENELIDAMTTAYGGDALVNLTSFQTDDHFISPSTGQSRNPNLEEITYTRGILKVDLENNKAFNENWSSGRGGSFHNATDISFFINTE